MNWEVNINLGIPQCFNDLYSHGFQNIYLLIYPSSKYTVQKQINFKLVYDLEMLKHRQNTRTKS